MDGEREINGREDVEREREMVGRMERRGVVGRMEKERKR